MSASNMSRRMFLGTTAAAGAGAAGLAAAASPAFADAPATADASALPGSWDQETDVVVVGTGCGLAAAIAAKEAGADVVVIEKSEFVGGLFCVAGGNSIWGGTKIQKANGIEDTKEDWREDELYGCHHRGVPELIDTYIARADDTIEWFEDMGLVWGMGDIYQHPETNRVCRTHYPLPSDNYPYSATSAVNRGHAYTDVMRDRCDELDIPILTQHRMTKVYRDGDGPVVGVAVETPDGNVNIKARKAVILCTGTWTDNERLCQAWDPRIVGPDTYGDGGTPCDGTLFVDSSGDGHLACMDLGAAFSDMSNVCYLYVFFGSRSYWGCEPFDLEDGQTIQPGKGVARTADFYQSVIMVKADGKRFLNESLGAQTAADWETNRKLADPQAGALTENTDWPFTRAFLSVPQPRNIWAVADSATAASLGWNIDLLNNPDPKSGIMLDPECVAIADTVEELAEKMGMPADQLQATIDAYNGYVDSGVDEEFGKPDPKGKIEAAPFYGLKASLIRHTQRNGVRVNTKSQVIAQMSYGDDRAAAASIDDEPVIPHLYAAGELGDVMGNRLMHGSMGNYAIFARIAGENAALEEDA